MGLKSNLSPTHFPRRWPSLWPHTNLSPWPCRRSLPSSSVIRGVRVPSACKTSIYLDSSSNDLHTNCKSLNFVDHSSNFLFQYFLSLFIYIYSIYLIYIYILNIYSICVYMYLHNISTLFLESRQLILFAPFPRPKTAAPRSPLPRPPPVRPLRKRVKPASPGSAKTTRWMWSKVFSRSDNSAKFHNFFACKTLIHYWIIFQILFNYWQLESYSAYWIFHIFEYLLYGSWLFLFSPPFNHFQISGGPAPERPTPFRRWLRWSNGNRLESKLEPGNSQGKSSSKPSFFRFLC